jgi:uncharacterized membrane protein
VTSIVEWLTLVRMAGYFILCCIMARQMRVCTYRAEPLNWWLWAVHGIIYSAVFLGDYQDRIINAQAYNNWATMVGIHGLIVVIAIETYRLRRLTARDRHGC